MSLKHLAEKISAHFNTPPDPKDTSIALFTHAQTSANKILNTTEFRRELNYDRFPEPEQSRIFNELLTTALVYSHLAISHAIIDTTGPYHKTLSDIRDTLFSSFTDHLDNIGAAKKHTTIWRNLLDMRLEEYRQEQSHMRTAMHDNLADESEALATLAVRIETVTVGTLLHITRGQAKPEDKLRRLIRTWLTFHHRELRPVIRQ